MIDDKGNKIKDPESTKEKAAYSPFMRLCFRVKQMINKVPGGSTKMGSLAAAYLLLKEEEIMKIADFLNESDLYHEKNGKYYDPDHGHEISKAEKEDRDKNPEHHRKMKALFKHMRDNPKETNAGYQSDAEENRKRGWSNESEIEESLVKSIRRKIAGKDVNSRAKEEIEKTFDATLKGDSKEAKKHFRNFDRLDNLSKKNEDVVDEDAPVATTTGTTSANAGGYDKPIGKIVLKRFSDKKKEGEAAV